MKSLKNKLKFDILSRIARIVAASHGLPSFPSIGNACLQIIEKNQTNLRILNDEISKK